MTDDHPILDILSKAESSLRALTKAALAADRYDVADVATVVDGLAGFKIWAATTLGNGTQSVPSPTAAYRRLCRRGRSFMS